MTTQFEVIDGHFYRITRNAAGAIVVQAACDPYEPGNYSLVGGQIVMTSNSSDVVIS